MKRIVLTGLIVAAFGYQSMSQNARIKDDPQSRQAYEFQKLRNPVSERIPADIRLKELTFASRLAERARSSSLLSASTVWDHRGPFNVGGRTRALAVDANDENLILAGGVSGGLWRTTNQGATWSKVTAVSDLQSITCIVQDTTGGKTGTWYYGTGEFSGNSATASGAFFRGDGIYKSTDGGLSWSILAVTESGTPESTSTFDINHEILINPINGDLFVATFFGIYRSQDAGDTFSQLLAPSSTFAPDLRGWSDIVVTSTGILYASIEGDGIFKSADGGDTWINITDPLFPLGENDRIELGLAPSAEDTLYVIAEATNEPNDHVLWMYDDNDGGTASWEDRSTNIPMLGGSVGDFDSQGGYDLLVRVKPDDPEFVIIGGTNLYRSTDGFTTGISSANWIGGYSTANDISTYTNQHPDQHEFIFLSGNRALSGNDGGVQITDDITDLTANGIGETVDWITLNNGYLTSQVYAVSTGPGDQIISGFQDNGNWLTNSTVGDEDWGDDLVMTFGGDGAYSAFNQDGTERYISTQFARIFRVSYSNADELVKIPSAFQQIDPTVGYDDNLFVTPFYLDPSDDDIFYLAGDRDLFVNTQASTANSITGWKSISLSGVNFNEFVSEIGVTKSNLVYVGTDEGKLYKITDPISSNPAVRNITDSAFPAGYISSIGVNQENENELIVTFSNYEVISIWYSDDAGATFTDISGNLEENPDGSGSGPSARAARIVGNGFEYFVGTSTGLYSTKIINGSSTNWIQEGTSSIGNVVINHLATKDDGTVVVGTHGNGIFSTDINFLDTDLALLNLVVPDTGVLSSTEVITVDVINLGNLTPSTFDLILHINDTLSITETITQALNPSQRLTYSFQQAVDLTRAGGYDIRVEVVVNGDQDATNDESSGSTLSLAVPSDILLSNTAIPEDEVVGTAIGSFSTVDDDDTEHTYSLVSGTGDDDNASFSLNVDELRSADVFDFNEQSSFTIRVQTEDDDGNVFAKAFSIEVTNVLGLEDLENMGITMFPNPFSNQVSLEMINEYTGQVEMKVLSLDGRKTLIDKTYEKQTKRTRSMLDLSSLSSGVYLIQFELGDQQLNGKLIKQ